MLRDSFSCRLQYFTLLRVSNYEGAKTHQEVSRDEKHPWLGNHCLRSLHFAGSFGRNLVCRWLGLLVWRWDFAGVGFQKVEGIVCAATATADHGHTNLIGTGGVHPGTGHQHRPGRYGGTGPQQIPTRESLSLRCHALYPPFGQVTEHAPKMYSAKPLRQPSAAEPDSMHVGPAMQPSGEANLAKENFLRGGRSPCTSGAVTL